MVTISHGRSILLSPPEAADTPRRWGQLTSPSPTQVIGPGTTSSPRHVESLTETTTGQRFTEKRFSEDMDYDDAAIGEMLFNAYREQVYHSQRESLSVGQSSPSVSDRSGRPVVERGQELNTENEQIRTLLDRQREQILADCQAEIRKHEFQANHDRRSIQKLSDTIESQQEELHRPQAEERRREDQQLLHEQLLQQNSELREAHV